MLDNDHSWHLLNVPNVMNILNVLNYTDFDITGIILYHDSTKYYESNERMLWIYWMHQFVQIII